MRMIPVTMMIVKATKTINTTTSNCGDESDDKNDEEYDDEECDDDFVFQRT